MASKETFFFQFSFTSHPSSMKLNNIYIFFWISEIETNFSQEKNFLKGGLIHPLFIYIDNHSDSLSFTCKLIRTSQEVRVKYNLLSKLCLSNKFLLIFGSLSKALILSSITPNMARDLKGIYQNRSCFVQNLVFKSTPGKVKIFLPLFISFLNFCIKNWYCNLNLFLISQLVT